jgi:hypothetical protein
VDIQQEKGSVRDFKLYKDSIGEGVDESILIQADLGYLGIEALHPNCRIPKKSSKNHKLHARGKTYNKRLARKRVVIEHVNAKIKTFKIMAYPYRNHCRRHFLRMSFICGIIDFELCFQGGCRTSLVYFGLAKRTGVRILQASINEVYGNPTVRSRVKLYYRCRI